MLLLLHLVLQFCASFLLCFHANCHLCPPPSSTYVHFLPQTHGNTQHTQQPHLSFVCFPALGRLLFDPPQLLILLIHHPCHDVFCCLAIFILFFVVGALTHVTLNFAAVSSMIHNFCHTKAQPSASLGSEQTQWFPSLALPPHLDYLSESPLRFFQMTQAHT